MLHVFRDNCTDEQWGAAQELVNILNFTYASFLERHGQHNPNFLTEAVFEFGKQYGSVFSLPKLKVAFLKALLCRGSDDASRMDNEDQELHFHFGCCLFACAYKLVDKYDGVVSTESSRNIEIFKRDIMHCPREIVRFYHKHNSCNCLETLYSKLKKTTDRTTNCFGCGVIKDFREIKECSGCKVAQYCSRECQLSHWAKHKSYCKIIRESQAKGPEANVIGLV